MRRTRRDWRVYLYGVVTGLSLGFVLSMLGDLTL